MMLLSVKSMMRMCGKKVYFFGISYFFQYSISKPSFLPKRRLFVLVRTIYRTYFPTFYSVRQKVHLFVQKLVLSAQWKAAVQCVGRDNGRTTAASGRCGRLRRKRFRHFAIAGIYH